MNTDLVGYEFLKFCLLLSLQISWRISFSSYLFFRAWRWLNTLQNFSLILIGLVSNGNVQLVELRKFFLKTVSISHLVIISSILITAALQIKASDL